MAEVWTPPGAEDIWNQPLGRNVKFLKQIADARYPPVQGWKMEGSATVTADGNYRTYPTSVQFNNTDAVPTTSITFQSTGYWILFARQASSTAGTVRVALIKNNASILAQNATSLAGADNISYQPHCIYLAQFVAGDTIGVGGSATGGGSNVFTMIGLRLMGW